MLDLKCPECDGEVQVFLTKAEIVYKPIAGRQWRTGQQNSYQAVNPRQLGWNCLNKECGQRRGQPKPDNRSAWEKRMAKRNEQGKKLVERLKSQGKLKGIQEKLEGVEDPVSDKQEGEI